MSQPGGYPPSAPAPWGPGPHPGFPGPVSPPGGYAPGQASSPGMPQAPAPGGYGTAPQGAHLPEQVSSPAIPQAPAPGGYAATPQGGYAPWQASSPGTPPAAGGFGGYQPAPQNYPGPLHQASPGQAEPPGLIVDAGYSPFAFLLAITKPKIVVNGQRVPVTRWGANHVPVGPGQHHVRVSTPWLFDMGPATATVPVNPGQGTRVHYRAPVVIFLNGAIGPVPQKAPGLLFLYITWGVLAVLLLLNMLLLLGVAAA